MTAAFVVIPAFTQPPVAPDPRPPVISLNDLNQAIGGPTLVSVKMADAPPEKVFAALAEQAGLYFNAGMSYFLDADTGSTINWRGNVPNLTVAIERQPFLPKLQSLAARSGLSFSFRESSQLDPSATGLALQILRSKDPQLQLSGPVLVHGPFTVVATSVERSRTVALRSDPAQAKPAARGDVHVEFAIFADPKLRHRLIGEPDYRFLPDWDIQPVRYGYGSIWSKRSGYIGRSLLEWRYTAHRTIAPASEERTVTLKAKSHGLLVTTRSTVWEVPDILGAKETSRELPLKEGKRRYTVLSITPARDTFNSRRGDMYQVRLSLAGVGISKGRWSGWPALTKDDLVGAVRLVDADGRDFVPYTWDMKDNTWTGIFGRGARNLGKAPAGPPAKLLWELPTEIRSIEISVEFADLPLP